MSSQIRNSKTKAETIIFLPSKKIVTPNFIYVGMFCYSTEDNLIFPKIIPELESQLTSVVGFVKGNEIFSLCRKQEKLPWSSDSLFVNMPRGLSGIENTSLILDAAKEQNKKAEAAQYCHDYSLNGVKQGSAFLFSKEELEDAFSCSPHINWSLEILGEELLTWWLWSSSERDCSWASRLRFSGDGVYGRNGKIHRYYVRPGLVLTR